jgi:23S rRNA pseudouridine2605 synthase
MKAGPEIPKTYWVKVSGKPAEAGLEKLRTGIRMDGRMTAPARIRSIKDAENPWYEVILIEGRQNQIRRMFDHIGHLVEKLKRVKIGFLELGGLAPGEFRRLTPTEVERFKRMQPRKAAVKPAWTKSKTS